MNKLYTSKLGRSLVLFSLILFSFGFLANPNPIIKNNSLPVVSSFNPFGPAQGFGAFAFGDVDLIGSESEGPIAIGGDLIGFNNGYTVGPPNSPNPFTSGGTPVSLLIDGKVIWGGGSGELRITADGHLKIGDCSNTSVTQSGNITTASNGSGNPSIKVQGSIPQAAGTVCSPNLIDFDAAYTQMNNYSSEMASCPATTSFPNVTLSAGQNVINTTLSAIGGIQNINMNGTPPGPSNPLIINIDGQGATSGNWTVWNSTPQSSAIQYVIYHFYNIDNLTITANNGLWGSVFAPNTNLTINGNNNIEGQIVSQDLVDAGGEIHGHNNFASTIDGCGPGCTDPAVPTLTATPSSICNGGSATITISGSLNDATNWHMYTGSCGGTEVGTTGSNTFTVSPNSTTTYFIRGEGGCVTPGTCASVTVNVGNDPTAEAGGNGTIDCANTTVTLNGAGSSTGANISYLWTTNNGNIVSGATTLTPTVNASGTYTLTVTNTNSGCSSSDNAVVVSTGNPPIAQAGNPTTIIDCFNNPFYLNGTGTSTGPNITYLWTTNDGNILADETTMFPFINAAGTYTLTVTNTSNGCSSSDSIIVISNGTAPTVVATAANDLDCNNSTVSLSGAGSSTGSGITYLWTTNDGNIVSGETTLNPVVDAAGTYELTVTDPNCEDSASVTVSSNPDDEDPVVTCPEDETVNTDPGSCDAVVDFLYAGVSDNCTTEANMEFSFNPAKETPLQVGTNTITITATDESGNEGTCTYDITVEDNLKPSLECQDFHVVLDNSGEAEVTLNDFVLSFSDNCAIDEVYFSGNPDTLIDCSSVGMTIDFGIRARDTSGNVKSCQVVLTVEDNIDPIAECPDDITVDTDQDACNAEVDYTLPNSSDNCDVVSSSADIPSGSVFDIGTTTVTVTATEFNEQKLLDPNGGANARMGSAVDVTEDYMAISSINVSSGPGKVLIYEKDAQGEWIFSQEVSASDGVGGNNFGFDLQLSGDRLLVSAPNADAGGVNNAGAAYVFKRNSSGVWVEDVKLIANDPQNNSVFGWSCSIDDNQVLIGCMWDDTQGFDAGAAYYFKETAGVWSQEQKFFPSDPNAIDNFGRSCGIWGKRLVVSSIYDDDAGDGSGSAYIFERVSGFWVEKKKLTASDASAVDLFGVDVSIDDLNVVVGAIGDDDNGSNSGSAYVYKRIDGIWTEVQKLVASDGQQDDSFGVCVDVSDGNILIGSSKGDSPNTPNTGRAYVFEEDGMGFWNQTIMLSDLGSFSLGDIVGGKVAINGKNAVLGAIFDDTNGTMAGAAYVYNLGLNTDECAFTITVEDNEDPQANCPSDITVDTEMGTCSATVDYTIPDPEDNCGANSTVDISSGSSFDVGSTTVTVTATDDADNTNTCTFTVTVEDNEPPTAVCQDVVLDLDANGMAVLDPTALDGGSTDNCGSVMVSISAGDLDWTCADVGNQMVTLNVLDANGNMSTCESNVEIRDVIDPDAVCKDITIQLDTDGNAVITAEDIDGGSTDVCGIASLSIDSNDEDWDCDEVGSNTVTLTVTDTNGNESSCNATVTVEDNVDPEAVCQDITIQLDADGNASITAVDIDGGSTDACGIASLAIDSDDEDWGCDEVGSNTVTLTVTDTNGNESSCDATVTVEDNVAPEAVCQDITIQLDENGEVFIVAVDIDGGSNDACGIESISITADDEDWNCDEVGENSVILTVTDINGNESSCEAIVTVEDTIPPTLDCPDVVINLDPGLCGQVVQYAIETNDNCGVSSEVLIDGPASETYLDYHDSPWSVTWEVTDVNGNTSSCTFTITMNEYSNPTETLVCNDLVNIALDEDGCSEIGADMLLEGGPYGCYDDYIVDINFEGAEVCCDDIDETLYYTVTDPDTGNSCSGYIEVYDAIGPYCDFEEEIVVSCIDEIPSPEDTQSSIGFYDNCGIESIFLVSEELEDDDICDSVGEMVIVRIWGATDESGNAATELCEQHIVIEREDVFFPADATFDCASYTLDDLDPSLTGYPTAVQSSACAYEYNYSDVVLPSCGGLSQIVRTWTVLDICTDQIITTDANGTSNVQIIELIDTDGPSIDASEMTLYTDSDQCAFTGFIAAPSISDNCTGVISVQMFIDGLTELVYLYDGSGIPIGGYVEGAGMELGTYTLTITATDACGNISTAEVAVTIEDNVTPTAICDEITQVALQSDGTAEVFAETFDDGSHDNCCLEGFDVRRMDGAAFGATVSFDCSDIGATTQVILRVHDCHGNTNSCMVEVLVEDKIAPYLAVPAGTEISCEDYFANIAAELDNGNGAILDDMFGVATFGDNCEAILDYAYTYGVDQCGEGTITRSWTVNDPSGNGPVSGTQTITIYHVSDWSISFPGDLDATCVDGELPDFGTPTISNDDCEMIAVSHTDTQYDVVPDACYKIVREWSAINWCTYPDEAAVTATQVIKVTDDEAPIFDVEDFTVDITEADCDVAVTLPTPDVTDCSDDITIETSSDLPAGEAGPGTYTATYTVSDGCGNFSYDVITITVVDAKKPTPYVTDHLVTEIMQTGMTQLINVNDYDIGSFDNCSDVVLSFSPDVTDTDVQFTCDDIGENTLEIWVTDEAGNQDFVTVTMEVQDNMEACGPGSLTVAGALHTSDEQGIEDATVDINGGLFSQITDETGTFGFDLETGGDYSVVPSLDLNASNGVTTFDIVLITQHILGMNPFTDPLNLIAADANNSNTVTTLDVVAIRMVILQITDAFPNNTSWRFVDKDHVFTDPTNPWDFPEVVNINNLDEEMLDVDFTGIKIGDVNGSVQANFMSPAENRSGNSFELKTMDKQVSAGDEVRVTLQSDARISGMQFTLEHNGLEYKSMEAGLLNAEHIASHESALTFSWNEFELKDLSGEDLVTLIFEAKGNVQLSESMVITSSMTKAEGYTEQGIESVDLVFENNKSIANVLYQNVPNPFDGQTVVNFRLNKAGKAQILITDVDGKLIQDIEGTYPQGLNSVELDRIQKAGVYYYQLNTEGFTATKKMIKI